MNQPLFPVDAYMHRDLIIYDTTLRDGEQAPGNSMTLEQKWHLFRQLDDLGVHYVDIGFPAGNELDFKLCQQLMGLNRKSKLSALARANELDLHKTIEAFGPFKDNQIQILLLGSEIHVEKKRKITTKAAIEEAKAAVKLTKKAGIQDISVALEDASRGSLTFLRDMIEACVAEGATTVVLPDTVGAMLPEEIKSLVAHVRSWVGPHITVAIHCHNDMGLATANTIAAIQAGANCIQTTLCGIGERTGNAALEEIITILYYKKQYFNKNTNIDMKKMYKICKEIMKMLHLDIGKHKAIIGDNAFATSAGIHIHGLINHPEVYEFVKPEDFGLKQTFIINRHAGRAAIKDKILKLGLKSDPLLVDTILLNIKSASNSEMYNDDMTFMRLYQKIAKLTPNVTLN